MLLLTKKKELIILKLKKELIEEHYKLNQEFVSKIGKENVFHIAVRMFEIEDELKVNYGFDLLPYLDQQLYFINIQEEYL